MTCGLCITHEITTIINMCTCLFCNFRFQETVNLMPVLIDLFALSKIVHNWKHTLDTLAWLLLFSFIHPHCSLLFIHLLVHEFLTCIWFGATKTKATMNILVQVFVSMWFFISLGKMPWGGMTGSCEKCMFKFLKNLPAFKCEYAVYILKNCV